MDCLPAPKMTHLPTPQTAQATPLCLRANHQQTLTSAPLVRLSAQGRCTLTNSPTHDHLSNPTASTMPAQPPRSILRKLTDNTLRSQLNDSSSNDTQFLLNSLNKGNDRVIHDKSNKLLKELTVDTSQSSTSRILPAYSLSGQSSSSLSPPQGPPKTRG